MNTTPDNTENTDTSANEPEPIDAEFEPAEDNPADKADEGKSGIGFTSLVIASSAAALAGGAIGVVASGSSGVDTAIFAPAEVKNDVTRLEFTQKDLAQRIQAAEGTLAELDARSDGATERIDIALEAREQGELSLRNELDSLTQQLTILLGDDTATEAAANGDAGETASPDGSPIETPSPLKRLIDRIDTLETRLAEDAEGPNTPAKLQRALRELTVRVDEAEVASDELERAIETRAQALASLQTGLFAANKAISDVEARLLEVSEAGTGATGEAVTADTSALEAELDTLKEQIAALSAASNAAPASTPIEEPSTNDEGDNSAANTATETSGEDTSSSSEMETADTALIPGSDTNATNSETDEGQFVKASLALAAVDASSKRGKPFAGAWDRLDATMPDNEHVQAMKNASRRGAPPISELRAEFEELEDALVKKASNAQKGDGWDWARQAFGGVVNVRRTDGKGGGPIAIAQNMSKALEEDDLARAVELADTFEAPYSQDIADWTRKARLRLVVNEKLEIVRAYLLSTGESLKDEG